MGRYGLGSQDGVEADMRDGMKRVWEAVVNLEVGHTGGNGKESVDDV